MTISLLSLLLLLFVHTYWSEEKLLNEGGKELVNIINRQGVFLLHPERWPLFVTQLLPVVGVWLKLPLTWLIYCYALNLVLLTVTISAVARIFGDNLAGFYLSAMNLIGVGLGFFIYPFSEPLHALLFSYLLYSVMKGDNLTYSNHAVGIFLAVYIASFHQNAVLFPFIALLAAKKQTKVLYVHGALVLSVFFGSLWLTEVDSASRFHELNFRACPSGIGLFAFEFPFIIFLWLLAVGFSLRRSDKVKWIVLLMVAMVPAFFYGQVPDSYSLVTTGSTVLFYATHEKLRGQVWVVLLLMVSMAWSVQSIWQTGESTRRVKQTVLELVKESRHQRGNMFVLDVSEIGNIQRQHEMKALMDGSIRHASLIYSSLGGPQSSVVIDDRNFIRYTFQMAFKDQEIGNELGGFDQLYEERSVDLSYEHSHEYEYARYFFTGLGLNKHYFGLGAEADYRYFRPSDHIP